MRRCNSLIGDKEIAVIETLRHDYLAAHFLSATWGVAPSGVHDVPFSFAIIVGVNKHLVPSMSVCRFFGIGHGGDIFVRIAADSDCLDVLHAAKQRKRL